MSSGSGVNGGKGRRKEEWESSLGYFSLSYLGKSAMEKITLFQDPRWKLPDSITSVLQNDCISFYNTFFCFYYRITTTIVSHFPSFPFLRVSLYLCQSPFSGRHQHPPHPVSFSSRCFFRLPFLFIYLSAYLSTYLFTALLVGILFPSPLSPTPPPLFSSSIWPADVLINRILISQMSSLVFSLPLPLPLPPSLSKVCCKYQLKSYSFVDNWFGQIGLHHFFFFSFLGEEEGIRTKLAYTFVLGTYQNRLEK